MATYEELEEFDQDGISTGIIRTDNANRRVWLVKIPDFLADRLADIDEDGLELGTVRATPGNNGNPPQVKLVLSSNGPCSDLPLEYDMQLSRCAQTLHLFCEDFAGNAIAVDGKVEQECQLKPVLDDNYRSVLRMRDEQANKPKRSIQLVDPIADSRQVGLIPHVSEHEMLLKRRKKYEPEQRKERLPKEEVLNMLFNAFDRTPHWTLKGLIDLTQQPSVYLKELLTDIAVYNTRGPYKNLYELKSDFNRAPK